MENPVILRKLDLTRAPSFFFVSPEKRVVVTENTLNLPSKSSSPLQYRESDKLEKEADNCDYDQDNRLVLMVVLPMPGSLP